MIEEMREPTERDKLAAAMGNDGVPFEEICRKLKFRSVHELERRIRWTCEWVAFEAAKHREEST